MGTSEEMKFRILYDGPILDNHQMEIRDLAPALMSLSDAIDITAKHIYGPKTKMSIKVKASFREGSFGIDFSIMSEIIGDIVRFLTGSGVTAALNVVGVIGIGKLGRDGIIQLIKWVNGRSITKIVPTDNDNVTIYIGEDYRKFEIAVVELYKNYKLRQALEGFIKKPLEREGIDSFASTIDEGKTFIAVNKKESQLFYTPKEEENIITDENVDMVLYLDSISFKEDRLWSFSTGSFVIKATIEDKDFLKKIDNRLITFAKGDILKVTANVSQWFSAGKLHTSYKILKVNEKIEPPEQMNLPS
ncbi:hypothetical protein [Orbus mooreae]|uniref:hypothetical protein n=1 Tax=Orbus mooreae TaxID=3074107 RepID=UPI00370D8A96